MGVIARLPMSRTKNSGVFILVNLVLNQPGDRSFDTTDTCVGDAASSK